MVKSYTLPVPKQVLNHLTAIGFNEGQFITRTRTALNL